MTGVTDPTWLRSAELSGGTATLTLVTLVPTLTLVNFMWWLQTASGHH